MRRFNTTAVCNPEIHFMCDLSERIAAIKEMVDNGEYFSINRARQFGKTTTLNELRKTLIGEYTVISVDFQGIGADGFRDEASFVKSFCRLIRREKRAGLTIPQMIDDEFNGVINRKQYLARFPELFDVFLEWFDIDENPIVLIIDEVDSASNNQVFLDFLSQLRDMYINREAKQVKTFQSVILAGVTDVKHLKSKIREDKLHKVNSPWNIAADFTIAMEFSEKDICGMLSSYCEEREVGMDIAGISGMIEHYTSGYPFLVSRICQIIDERLVPAVFETYDEAWTAYGVDEAVKALLSEKNTLFESLTGKLSNYPDFARLLRGVLMEGKTVTYNPNQDSISQMEMYGFVKNTENKVEVSNIIFEIMLYNLFLSDEEMKKNSFSDVEMRENGFFVKDGRLDVKKILERFLATYNQVYGPLEERFKEKDGRELFLMYLKPIINGTGNYYIEPQTRDQRRMDIVVDYLGTQYIIELKIWHGQRYNEDGEKQLMGYLDYFGLSEGYMLSFNFNKNKQVGIQEVRIGDKLLIEAVL